jgi:hypothetical protein
MINIDLDLKSGSGRSTYILKNSVLEPKYYNRAFKITQTVKKMFPEKYALIGMTSKLEAENGNLESAFATSTRFQDNYTRGDPIGDKIFQNR